MNVMLMEIRLIIELQTRNKFIYRKYLEEYVRYVKSHLNISLYTHK